MTENRSVVACGWGMMVHRGRDGWLGGCERLQKCTKKFGENNRYSHYLACGDGFMDVYMFRFMKWFVFLGFPGGSDGKVSACNVGDPGSIPGSGRSPGDGNGNPLQYSCLENPTDRGGWQAQVHGVAESDMT